MSQTPSSDDNEAGTPYHTIDSKDGKHHTQSRLKLWSNKLRRAARTDRVPSHRWEQPMSVLPLEIVTPTRLLSNASSYNTKSSPSSPPPELGTNYGNKVIQPSSSQSTAEIDNEFGFAMQRMRCDSGQYMPRLYLDMPRQSSAFSPFRPFSPGVLTPASDPAPFHYINTTSSFDKYRKPSDTLSLGAGNRFYSKENLDALGVNRAPTADSRLSTTATGRLNPFEASSGRNTPSIKSFNTPRSLSGLSLSILPTRENSVKSTTVSRNTTPSFPLASPISFC